MGTAPPHLQPPSITVGIYCRSEPPPRPPTWERRVASAATITRLRERKRRGRVTAAAARRSWRLRNINAQQLFSCWERFEIIIHQTSNGTGDTEIEAAAGSGLCVCYGVFHEPHARLRDQRMKNAACRQNKNIPDQCDGAGQRVCRSDVRTFPDSEMLSNAAVPRFLQRTRKSLFDPPLKEIKELLPNEPLRRKKEKKAAGHRLLASLLLAC